MAPYPWPVTKQALELHAVIFKTIGGQRHWVQATAILRSPARTP
jgi:hypothetical protein